VLTRASRCQFLLLLRNNHFQIYRNQQLVCHLNYPRFSQCWCHNRWTLDCQELRPPQEFDGWCRRYVRLLHDLRIRRPLCPRCRKSHVHPNGRKSPHCLHLSLHCCFRHNMGTTGLGCCWRALPSPLPRTMHGSRDSIQLALQLPDFILHNLHYRQD